MIPWPQTGRLHINAVGLDGGAIEVVGYEHSVGDGITTRASLNIAPDAPHAGAPNRQWFYFRVTGTARCKHEYRLLNAGACSYPGGWDGYCVYYSTGGDEWACVEDTTYVDGVLSWRHASEAKDCVEYAYYPPYSRRRQFDLIERTRKPMGGCGPTWQVRHQVLGLTLDGDTIDCLVISGLGGPPRAPPVFEQGLAPAAPPAKRQKTGGGAGVAGGNGKLNLWVLARQHPGETQASWWIEGCLEALGSDVAYRVLEKANVYVVPNMNPDGGRRGYLRVNAAGANLNREWDKATMLRSPEVFTVRAAMHAVGVDFCVDVHSEEELPYCFVSKTPLAIPSLTARQRGLYEKYVAALCDAAPTLMQDAPDKQYKLKAPGSANLGICSAYVAETFGCLACTQEMPFKANAHDAGATRARGFPTADAKALGAAWWPAVETVLGELREE